MAKKSAKVIDRLSNKKTIGKKVNPFEIRINRKKHEVLGQKRDKGEKGYPGISRSRAIEKRKKTLLKEYKERRKTNQLVDRRFDKEDIPEEERDLQRFLLETKRRHERGNIYNLEESEEILTHYGHSLGDHYNDVILSSSDELELDADDHFGGFLHKKQSNQENESHKTRKEIMQEIVSKSKQHKHERQMERERIEDLLDTVNDQWKEIHGLLNQSSSTQPTKSLDEDDYDRYVVELSREPRGKPTERLKTEEEIAKEKKENLENLEEKRKKRMDYMRLSVDTHRSADDNTKSIKSTDKRVMIHYKDGHLVLPDGTTSLLAVKEQSSDVSNSDNENESEREESEEGSNEEMEEEENEGEEQNEDSEEDNVEESEVDEGENLDSNNNIDSVNEEMENLDEMESNDIPFVFKGVPHNVEELASLMHDRTPSECSTIVERIITCHHYSLSHDNKLIMEKFFSVLLDYCITVTDVLVLDKLVQNLFELSQTNSQYTLHCFQNKLKRYLKCLERNNFFFSPTLSDLVAAIFPTSDYQHPIVTPSLQLMTLALINGKLLSTLNGVCIGLCVCKIILEYISVSKRYVPELAHYLTFILDCFSKENVIQLSLPFTNNLKQSLSLFKFSTQDDVTVLSPVELLSYSEDIPCNQIKLSLLNLSLQLVLFMSQCWQSISSYDVIFNPILNILNRFSDTPLSFNDLIHSVRASLQLNVSRPKPILQILRRKPKSIVFYEPQFDEDYQPWKRKARDKSLLEKMKLKHKYKRELKGAIREIRKDNKFLAKEKLQEQIRKDEERKKKVKQIQGWLQQEQHDMKKEKLKKRK